MKIRKVIAYKNYLDDFISEQPNKVRNKIIKMLEAIEILERIPANYLKHITGSDGIYEVRVQLASNIWRIFCFFDGDRLVILTNGFQKKTQKTPKNEIERAIKIRSEYYEEKKNGKYTDHRPNKG